MRAYVGMLVCALSVGCSHPPAEDWKTIGVFSGPMEVWDRMGAVLAKEGIRCSDGGGSVVYSVLVPARDAERAKALLTKDAATHEYWFQTIEVIRQRQQVTMDLEDAERQLALGHFDEAIACFSSVISTEPGCVNAYLGRADARREKGDAEGAIEDSERARELLRVAGLPYEHLDSDIQALKETLAH